MSLRVLILAIFYSVHGFAADATPATIAMINKSVKKIGNLNAEACFSPAESANEWVAAGYKNPETWNMNLYAKDDPTQYEIATDLDIVMVRGSGWTPELLLERYRRVADIYKICKLKFERVRVVEVDPPLNEEPPPPPKPIYTFESGDPKTESTKRFVERAPAGSRRLTMMHVGGLKDYRWAASFPKWYVGEDSPLLNKGWVTSGVAGAEFKEIVKDETYLSEAHEIGHCLLDCDHPDEQMKLNGIAKNLMADEPTMKNGHLLKTQCARIKQNVSGVVRPI